MKRTVLISAIIVSASVAMAKAQLRGAVDFQLLKISTNFISSPQFTYTGAGSSRPTSASAGWKWK